VKGLLSKQGFKEKMASIITHRIPIRDIAKGMELIMSKQAGKVALQPKW
jgi:threonine dehydrogenase-like Zn-dependent dehydrogenase